MNIPVKIYLNIIIVIIFLVLGIGAYIYFNTSIKDDKTKLTFLIWYVVILEANLIYFYYTLKFYHTNKNIKGPKGEQGEIGPKGFKGENQICSSCGDAGSNVEPIYTGDINDNGVQINNPMVSEGQCIFPFIHNHQYKYSGCIKDKTPMNTDDAKIYGWCPTSLDTKQNPLTFGYCNKNNSLKDAIARGDTETENQKKYIENNYGILDVEIVSGNNETEAKQQCDDKGHEWKIIDQDLNEGTDGTFMYVCQKKGFGNKGIEDIQVLNDKKLDCKTISESDCNDTYNNVCNWKNGKCNSMNYKSISNGINLNENVVGSELYMYKKYTNSKFIKDLQFDSIDILMDSSGLPSKRRDTHCSEKYDDNYFQIHENLNEGVENSNQIVFCGSKVDNIVSIDTAFKYKDGMLYIFRGNKYYKMSKLPIQSAIKALEGYPKKITTKWLKNDDSDDDCSMYNTEPTKCDKSKNCSFDCQTDCHKDIAKQTGSCEPKMIYNAVFTYGHNKKTYFFKGTKVYLYDDEKMTVAAGYPKDIGKVFKGVPSNITAAFTWGKDGKTYFFKGPLYYKYNDKQKKVEAGYPKRANQRWIGMPKAINAIFTLDNTLEGNSDNHPTYIISGDQSYYIDPITDRVKTDSEYVKPLNKRFLGIDYDLDVSVPTKQ